MQIRGWIGLIALTLEGATALAAPAADPGPTGAAENTRPAPRQSLPGADREVLQKLHDANQMEIQMGQLATTAGSSKRVKDFGRQLARDHAAADKQIDAFLRTRGLDITALATTTSADTDHSVLATKNGPAFDRAFSLQMIEDHQKAIDMLKSARIATANENLTAMYDALIPVLESHQRTARAIASEKAGV